MDIEYPPPRRRSSLLCPWHPASISLPVYLLRTVPRCISFFVPIPFQAVHKVQQEAQERYDAAVAAGEDEEALPPRVVGVCVGEGEAMGMLEGADGVVCVGWKAGEELARVVASCDVMVAPSEVSRNRSKRAAVYRTDQRCTPH